MAQNLEKRNLQKLLGNMIMYTYIPVSSFHILQKHHYRCTLVCTTVLNANSDKSWLEKQSLLTREHSLPQPVLRIRDVYPGSRILIFIHPGSRIPNPNFRELSDKFLGKKFYNSLTTDPNFYLQHLKNRIIFNFMKFVATKKDMTTNFFHPSLL